MVKASEIRIKLEAFLMGCDGDFLRREFESPWLNDLIPGLALMIGCDQGTSKHLEGDVAVHTGLVFDNLIALARSRLGREADFIERLSVLLHDCRKPQTRTPLRDGGVAFPSHEELGAREVSRIAAILGLSDAEEDCLYFIVAKHGEAHGWADLSLEQQGELSTSPWNKSLALLQEADARACILKDGGHLSVFWSEIAG